MAASTPVFINIVFRRLNCESITLRVAEVAAAPRLDKRMGYGAVGHDNTEGASCQDYASREGTLLAEPL